jgi:hypothetical protein
MTKLARMLLALAAATALAAPPTAGAKEEEKRREKPKPETRRIESTGKFAFTRLQNAQKALSDGKVGEALSNLNELKGREDKLSEYEQAMMWQTFAYAYSAQERYAQAVEAFEKCLATNALPPQSAIDARYNMAQLYLVLENYRKAIENFEIWFKAADNPSGDAHYMMAAAYAQAERPREALPHAKAAVAKAGAPKESWLQLLLSLHFQLEQMRDAAGVLEKLIATFPKKTYWMQLAAAYTQLDDKKKALATLELAERQGFLSSENEVRNLIQLYLANDIPYRAALKIEQAMADGRLSNNARNQELLANTWLHARERERAVAPLERAAELSGDGNLYVRLGQVHLAEERWGPARSALSKALAKGGLRDAGNVHLLLGIAHASESRWREAEQAFAAARKYDSSAKSAAQWLSHIEEELALDEYEKNLERAAEQGASAAAEPEAVDPAAGPS